uniref:hypothetical protein n=1 Tax=Acinetobacter baumannii TaxID=470 RepID=UPI001C0973C9
KIECALVDVSGIYFSFSDFLILAAESMPRPLNKFQSDGGGVAFITNGGIKSVAMRAGERRNNGIAHE